MTKDLVSDDHVVLEFWGSKHVMLEFLGSTHNEVFTLDEFKQFSNLVSQFSEFVSKTQSKLQNPYY